MLPLYYYYDDDYDYHHYYFKGGEREYCINQNSFQEDEYYSAKKISLETAWAQETGDRAFDGEREGPGHPRHLRGAEGLGGRDNLSLLFFVCPSPELSTK